MRKCNSKKLKAWVNIIIFNKIKAWLCVWNTSKFQSTINIFQFLMTESQSYYEKKFYFIWRSCIFKGSGWWKDHCFILKVICERCFSYAHYLFPQQGYLKWRDPFQIIMTKFLKYCQSVVMIWWDRIKLCYCSCLVFFHLSQSQLIKENALIFRNWKKWAKSEAKIWKQKCWIYSNFRSQLMTENSRTLTTLHREWIFINFKMVSTRAPLFSSHQQFCNYSWYTER